MSWDVVLGHEASRAKTRWLVTLVGNRGAEGREGRGASGVMRVSHPLTLVTLAPEAAAPDPHHRGCKSLNTCRGQRGAAHAIVQHVGWWFRRHIKNRANKTK